uniref:Uncharacterized protein n=1 Tax=Leersia perrieri TaxID=77586 RepID=A0A0D9XZN8_9ORYZ
MKLLLEGIEDKDRLVQYLPAWLSVVGQAVGLKIPLELYGLELNLLIWTALEYAERYLKTHLLPD